MAPLHITHAEWRVAKTMRITLFAFGSRGDVQPHIALGVGLRAAGHSVRIVTHALFEPLITRLG
ncbi:MAG: glycosyltransferase family 1 protein, partial [Chloroflexi bacterium]